MNETNAEPYPMDFLALAKGDYIDPEKCQKITRKQAGTCPYQLALLGLAKRIEKEMAALGEPVTVKQEGAGLRILTDLESSEYNMKQMRSHVIGTYRRARHLVEVDSTEFTPEQDRAHQERLRVAGFITAFLRKGVRESRKAKELAEKT